MVWGVHFQEKYYSLVTKPITRFIQTSAVNGVNCTGVVMKDSKNTNEVTPSTKPPTKSPGAAGSILGGIKGEPTGLDKIFLVWSGKYKSTKEIPKQLDAEVIHKARSFSRIRINIGFLLIAAAGGALMIHLGRRDVSRGVSLQQQNLDWHRKVRDDYEREQGKRRN